jgi:hypothetical protein
MRHDLGVLIICGMRPSWLFATIVGTLSLGTCGSTGRANPIAVDTSRRMATMIAEDVRVLVGAGESKVSGVFKFRLEEPSALGEDADARVRVYVPVLSPRDGIASDVVADDRPIVRMGRHQITGVAKNSLPYGDKMEFVKLPKGWLMRFYRFEIPARFAGKQFEIAVSYVQPHFPGDVAGYVPLDPPSEPGVARITFEAAKGRALKRIGGLNLFPRPLNRLEVAPQNRKLIRVRSIPSGR